MELPANDTPVEDLPTNPVAKSPCGSYIMDLEYCGYYDEFRFQIYYKQETTHLYFWGLWKRQELKWVRSGDYYKDFDKCFQEMIEKSNKRLRSIVKDEKEKEYRAAGY